MKENILLSLELLINYLKGSLRQKRMWSNRTGGISNYPYTFVAPPLSFAHVVLMELSQKGRSVVTEGGIYPEGVGFILHFGFWLVNSVITAGLFLNQVCQCLNSQLDLRCSSVTISQSLLLLLNDKSTRRNENQRFIQ